LSSSDRRALQGIPLTKAKEISKNLRLDPAGEYSLHPKQGLMGMWRFYPGFRFRYPGGNLRQAGRTLSNGGIPWGMAGFLPGASDDPRFMTECLKNKVDEKQALPQLRSTEFQNDVPLPCSARGFREILFSLYSGRILSSHRSLLYWNVGPSSRMYTISRRE